MDEIELVDICDENDEKIGVEKRDIVHEKGLWHREVAVLVINDGKLLLQRRSPEVKSAPNKLGLCGGHVGFGETTKMAAKREIAEEIGLEVELDEFDFVGIKKKDSPNDKAFKYYYAIMTDKDINEFKMQEEEVTELIPMDIEELQERVNKKDDEITFAKADYAQYIVDEINKRI